jgi:DinB family protein
MANEIQTRTMTQQERDAVANRLSESYRLLLDTVATLTPEQWNFKPSLEQWSIAECVEHLAVSEAAALGRYQRMLAAPAAPGKESALTDEQLAEKVADRSQKFKAPDVIAPSRRWSDPKEALKQFKDCRDQGLAQLKDAGANLRSYFSAHPAFGDLDGLQWMGLRAGHTERHTAQIKAIQASPEYPH